MFGRLSARPGLGEAPDAAVPGDPADDDPDDASAPVPSWVPEGSARGRQWLTAVRTDPGRAGGLALAVIALLAVLITVFTLVRSQPAPVMSANLPPVREPAKTSSPGSPAPPAPEQDVVVSVVGLVNQPGLVTVAPQARVADAVQAAGGPLTGADTLGLNLARRVADGEQIVVGIATPAGRRPALGSSAGAAPSAPAPTVGESPAPASPVDLNSATAEQLEALPGVGPVMAAAIRAWRQANGPFAGVDQLGEVDGIGPARLEKLRSLVRV